MMRKKFLFILAIISVLVFASCQLGKEPVSANQKITVKTDLTKTLNFTAESDKVVIELDAPVWLHAEKSELPSILYYTEKKGWRKYLFTEDKNMGFEGEKIFLQNGEKVYFYNESSSFSKDKFTYLQFVIDGFTSAGGSILSLINEEDSGAKALSEEAELPSCSFFSLFKDCTTLTSAPDLPSTSLGEDCYSGMFSGCSALKKGPTLPSIELKKGCYDNMFSGCTSLTYIEMSYDANTEFKPSGMFTNVPSGNSGLTVVGTEVAGYKNFESVDSFIDATWGFIFKSSGASTIALNKKGEAPAEVLFQYKVGSGSWEDYTLGTPVSLADKEEVRFSAKKAMTTFSTSSSDYFYFTMDGNISAQGDLLCLLGNGLDNAGLSPYCFYGLFENCSSLKSFDVELSENVLKEFCYAYMFSGCTGLTEAPELQAPQLVTGCYNGMFKGCTGIDTLELGFSSWSADCTEEMITGAAETGVAYYKKGVALDKTGFAESLPNGWKIKMDGDYLCFTAKTKNVVISLKKQGKPNNISLEYRKGTIGEWTPFAVDSQITLGSTGDSVFIRAVDKNATFSTSSSKYYYFTVSDKASVSGSIMSLMDKNGRSEEFVSDYQFYSLFKGCMIDKGPDLNFDNTKPYCFASMFSGCTALTQIPDLSSLPLSEGCFQNMFSGCTGLKSVADFTATMLAKDCYNSMFSGCTGLTKAPALPAETLAVGCYQNMFNGCTSLSTTSVLSAETLAESCCQGMYTGCTSLTTISTISATTLAKNCFNSMFAGCTSLTQTPALLAETLAEGCYQGMFTGCTGLTTISTISATTLAKNCFNSMFAGCTSLTQTPALPAETLAVGCYQNMFSGCTSLTTTSTLSVNTLVESCYQGMYTGCTSLTTISTISATTLAKNCFNSMFAGCTSLTQTPALLAETLAEGCYQGMFTGCTGLTTISTISATTLAKNCFNSMFAGCTSLTQTPALPAETLAEGCYQSMFANCTALKTAPVLPAKTLVKNCYNSMFAGCIALTQAPSLSGVTTVAESCCEAMFKLCVSLTAATVPAAKTSATSCYMEMYSNCKALTTVPAVLPATKITSSCYSAMFQDCDSLVTPPAIAGTNFASECYCEMFEGCDNLFALPYIYASGQKPATDCTKQMFKDCPKIFVSKTKNTIYKNDFFTTAKKQSIIDLFPSLYYPDTLKGTSGSETGDLEFKTTYYTANDVIKLPQ